MRKDWEVKKLGDICEIISGSTPKTNVQEFWNGNNYWVTPAEIDGKYISSTVRTITDEGVKSANLKLLPKGTVLFTSRAPIGKVAIVEEPMYCNQGFKNLICSNYILNNFLYWFLIYNVDYITSLGRGATFKEISKQILSSVEILLPPLQTQQQIVEELDCLTSIIEKQKKQLEELDNLAQSIFYDMFGDPIENEKGWNVKNLDEVCDVRDGTHDSPKYLLYSDYVLITSKNIANGKLDFTNVNYISKSDFDKINLRSKVDKGDILMAMIGTIGNPIIVNSDKINFCIKNMALIKLIPNSLVHRLYLHSLLSSKSFDELVKRINKGGTQKFIALGTIRKLIIPLPPLSLQQEFASKIEAIEKQKELIKKSIKETEDLFNSRKDYYFN